MQRLRHPLIVTSLIACGVMLVVLSLSPRWMSQRLAADLQQRIVAADEEPASDLVQQLTRLGDAGLAPLVELLDDHRPGVRVAARDSLTQLLDGWLDERTAASERSAALLAHSLAHRPPPQNLHSRVFVKLTALRLLRWPGEANTMDRTKFLADCSTILERTLNAHFESVEVVRRSQPLPAPAISALQEERDAEPTSESVVLLPEAIIEAEPEAIVEAEPEEEITPSEEGPSSPPPGRLELDSPRQIRSAEIALPTTQIDEAALRSLLTRSLIRHLQGVPLVAEMAEQELRRRGFDETTLQVARGLDDPDPQVRQQLAEALPQMADVDAMPWLWALAEDSDENVRRTVRNILATSNNPLTRARAARLKP